MSFSIDITPIFEQAASVVNSMMPIVVVVSGLGLGFGLVAWIGKEIRSVV